MRPPPHRGGWMFFAQETHAMPTPSNRPAGTKSHYATRNPHLKMRAIFIGSSGTTNYSFASTPLFLREPCPES